MNEKKDSPAHPDAGSVAEANRRRLEEVQRYWTSEAIESAKPLPLELNDDECGDDLEPGDPEEVDEKREG